MRLHRSRSLSRTALAVFAVLVLSTVARAQFNAAVQGTVTDANGAAVPGATVTLTSAETRRAQTATTSDDGFYRFNGLAPGLYTIEVEGSGFAKRTVADVRVNAEDVTGQDVVLTTGGLAESVTVTADAAPALETENANVAKSITTEEVLGKPQFGRDPYELLRLTPGVFGTGSRSGSGNSVGLPNTTGPGGSNTSIFQVENQVPISANGQRVSANNFEIDGVSVNSLGFGGAAVVTPNQESVKEIRVLSTSYSARDGRNSGAQIQVVSQNGTNVFHGSLFFKYNEPGLNAFNKYGGINNAPRTRVENKFRNFGGSVGGPILKDKLFFFFSYEGLRNRTNNTFNAWIETPQFRQQVISARPGGVTAAIFQSAGIEPRVVSPIPVTCANLFSNPTERAIRCRDVAGGLDLGSPVGGLGTYVGFGDAQVGGGFDGVPDVLFAQLLNPVSERGHQFNPRFDYVRGKDTFAFGAYVTRQDSVRADPGSRARPSSDLTFKPLNTSATVTWNRTINQTTLNELRFNATRFSVNQVSSNPDVNFGIPRVEVEGLPIDRIRFGAPREETSPGIFAQNQFELNDNLTKVWGNMAWEFGGAIRWEQDNNNLVGGARPVYSFVGLFNLANDTPIFEAINTDPSTGAPADAQRYFRTNNYSLYAQNNWKARPNLTLGMGLRWEYFTPLREKQGRVSNLIFGPNGLRDSRVEVLDELYEPDRNNFGPRLSFAWSPARLVNWNVENRLVLRGGFGIHYNRIPNVLFTNSRGNPPFFARNFICCGTPDTPFVGGRILYATGADRTPFSYPINPALATGIDPATGGLRNNVVEIWGAQQDLPNAYVYAYSLDGQLELPFRLVAELGYQGSSSHKLIRIVNQRLLFGGNPPFDPIFFPQPDVNANFNALNARLRRRFSRGFEFDAYYRWAKSIDTLSYEGPGAVTNQTNPGDLASERGPSDYDTRHYFVLSGLYELPFFRNRNDWTGRLLGGFNVSGILTAHTGFPWTPKIFQDLRQPSGATIGPIRPPAYFGGALEDTDDDAFIRAGGNFPGGGTQYFLVASGPPGIGRNSFRGPHYFNIDMSVFKRTPLPNFLGEETRLELRANFFNIFNMLNLAPIGYFDAGAIVTDPNFGLSREGLSGRVIELQARFSF
jgi:hypothetical protein